MPKSETFNMDCVEYLKNCADRQFSCALIDPPYGSTINADWDNKKTGRFGGLFKKYHGDLAVEKNINHAQGGNLFKKYGDEAAHWDTAPSESFWDEIFRVCEHLFVWGGNYFPLPPSRNWIIWEKTIPENFSMAMLEMCWSSVPGNAKIIKCGAQDKFRFHPCLPAGEKVFFSGAWKNIEDVRVGELNQYGRVAEVSKHIADYVIEIQVNGFVTRATGNHPFLALRDNRVYWITADLLKSGDKILADYSVQNSRNQCKEKRFWQKAGIELKKDISGNGTTMENSIWSIALFGKSIMDRFRRGCIFTTKTAIRKTIILKILSLLMPLRTSGITPVADLLTVFGRNNAICVENGICLPKKNGIFTSLAKMLGIQLGKYAKSVLSKELSSIKEFAVREIDSVKKLDGKISVFNLTIDGIPAFSTLAGESHNTQKPRILYDKILEWYGDKFCREKGIIDTFLGSGSSRLSAWDAGIDFVGIELNEVYFQKQELRFAEHVAKGSLYDRKEIETAECGEGLFEILLKRCDNPPAGFQRVF